MGCDLYLNNSCSFLCDSFLSLNSSKFLILTDDNVYNLHLNVFSDLLDKINHQVYIISNGEKSKSLSSFEKLVAFLHDNNFDRDSVIVCFGGGVVGDLGGFVASCYYRGIRYIHIPTTLIAQIDSSIGCKTGVNISNGKNIIGSFYNPCFIYTNTDFLKTLSDRDYRSGLAEAVKYAFLDSSFYDWLYKNRQGIVNRDDSLLAKLVHFCCNIKQKIIKDDPLDTKGIRYALNFGHTFGHALESITAYKTYTHGEAVSIGMSMAIGFSNYTGIINKDFAQKLTFFIQSFNLITHPDSFYDVDLFISLMQKDKKNNSGLIKLILIDPNGKTIIKNNIDYKILHSFIFTFLGKC